MKRKVNILLLGLALTAILGIAQNAGATLGQPADSLAADQKALSARRNAATVRNGYTIQEVESDAAKVREFISPSGIVFAIAWDGIVQPDLVQLLGSYFEEYRDAQQKNPGMPGRRSLQVKTNRVVVEKWGHMRSVHGRAYVPALIPSGVNIHEIR